MAKKADPTRSSNNKIVATNRKARHNYSILDTYEAGIQLVGTEVKSLRDGQASLADAFATVDDGVNVAGVAQHQNAGGDLGQPPTRRDRAHAPTSAHASLIAA